MYDDVRRVGKNKFPLYMCEGSTGPAVNLLLAFLAGVEMSGRLILDLSGNLRIIPDSEFGEMARMAISKLQQLFGLQPTGDFDQILRNELKSRFGFDFEAACRTMEGDSRLTQSNGSIQIWNPKG